MVKKDQLCAIALMKRRFIYGVLLKMVGMATSMTLLSIDASSFCPLIKQDLTFEQTHLVSFCFLLCNELKLTVNACFQCFLQALSGNNLFCTKPSGQILLCQVTDVKCYDFWFTSS